MPARLACLLSHDEPMAPKGPQPSEVRASWPPSTDGRAGLICVHLFGAGGNYVLVGGGSHPNVDPPPQTPSAFLDISVKLNENHQSAKDGNPLPDCPTRLCRHPLRLPVERTAYLRPPCLASADSSRMQGEALSWRDAVKPHCLRRLLGLGVGCWPPTFRTASA